MTISFFKADPTANVQWPQSNPGEEPTLLVVALQRDADPDATNRDGFDYFGASGATAAITAWAGSQPLTAVAKTALPKPPTFFPAPFSEA